LIVDVVGARSRLLTIHETRMNMNIYQTEKKLGPTKETMERPTHIDMEETTEWLIRCG